MGILGWVFWDGNKVRSRYFRMRSLTSVSYLIKLFWRCAIVVILDYISTNSSSFYFRFSTLSDVELVIGFEILFGDIFIFLNKGFIIMYG
jgi:hypothetical protein